MRVFIAGATGVIGRRLVNVLSDGGHDVVGLVRDDEGAAVVEELGGTARYGDVLDRDSLPDAMAGAAVVIHAATALPVTDKPTDADWARNDRVRVEGMRNLLRAADDTLSWVLFPSIVWVARQPDGGHFNETAARHTDRATQSAADVEDTLTAAAQEQGFDYTILRLGFLYAPDTAHTCQMGEQLLDGDLPVVGGGLFGRRDAKLSLLHGDDAAAAFEAAIDARLTGLYHVVDEEPVMGATFFSTFADELDAPGPSRVPGWLARFFVGTEQVNFLTKGMPTDASAFREETEWTPTYPTYRDGLGHVVEWWEHHGVIRETSDGYEWVGEPGDEGRVTPMPPQ